jgi:hypothetical protein
LNITSKAAIRRTLYITHLRFAESSVPVLGVVVVVVLLLLLLPA